jgi:predicted patatin/cPLA2 family phospholipase
VGKIKPALVLEGGGMRGAYTSGILEAFMEENIDFSYIIGVSAGASNGAGFISKQRGRNKKVFVDYVSHKEYSGFKHWIREKSYFNMKFLFDTLPNELLPFDYDNFFSSETIFKICTTNGETGKPEYFDKRDIKDKPMSNLILQASSSLPIISMPVEINGIKYFDGGIVDSIPIKKSIEDGNKYNVIILTRNKEYRKGKQKLGFYFRSHLKKYPKVLEAIKKRHIVYNRTLDEIERLEKEGLIYVFRPIATINVGRMEKDSNKLLSLYNQGYKEAMEQMDDFRKWIATVSNE